MASFAAHRMLKATIATSGLACITLLGPASAQTDIELAAASEGQRLLIERIQDEQAREGINSPQLIAPLSALGLLYQESGDHGAAIAALDRARQITRVNYGLYTLEEATLLRRLVQSEETRGNAEAAWDLEQRLLMLARRHSDDPRTVPILHELGDKRIDILRRYTSGEFPPQIVLGCYYSGRMYSGGQGCRAGSRGQVIRSLLREAESYYMRAIDILLENGGYSDPRLAELLMALVHSSFAYERYELGRRALQYLFAYEVTNDRPSQAQVDALVRMADWDLLFARPRPARNSAVGLYEEIYEYLVATGAEQEAIDQAFAPGAPVLLPTFLPNRLVTEHTPDAAGYVDLAFDVTRHGTGERIQIIDSTASRAATERLTDTIEKSQFRPITANGRVENRSRVSVRYYVTE